MGEVFCDWSSVSMGHASGCRVWEGLRPLLVEAGFAVESPDLLRVGDGVARRQCRSMVDVFSVSGVALAQLRARGLFAEYLSLLGEENHRLTRSHLTRAFPMASDEATSAELLARYELGLTGAVRIGRKAIPPHRVSRVWGPNLQGVETGTVYFNDHQKGVSYGAALYDKRWERVRKGKTDPGPTLQVELKLGAEAGLSLRDLYEPSQAFYHYAVPDLVSAPGFVAPWHPRPAGGFRVSRRDVLPYVRLKSAVERSAELGYLIEQARLLSLDSDVCAQMFFALVRSRWEQFGVEVGRGVLEGGADLGEAVRGSPSA